VIWGAAVFPLLGGLYYWFPKVTGRMYDERLGQATFWLVFAGTNITFFPMHISGLLGMPRRVWTYPGHMGWASENLISTAGAFFLAGGLVLLAANLVASAVRGAPAGNDPFGGGTLEWTTTSPPPRYNFAVIPTVTSAYPAWDGDDRAADGRRLGRGQLVFEQGHETTTSTPVDGLLDEVVEMPSESGWPVVLAAVATLGFALILSNHYIMAAAFAVLAAAVLTAWHAGEPGTA
jgi:cytochrome c oxidase subunit 1/cytochrome c oxidase subunit I+III